MCKVQKLVRSIVYGLISVLLIASLIGCPDDSNQPGTTPPGTNPPGTNPPARQVRVNGLTAANTALSFELASSYAEEVRVQVALTPAPPDSTMIEFDEDTVAFTASVRIPLAVEGNPDATKRIRITGLTNDTEYTLTATTFDITGNQRGETAGGSATPTAPATAPDTPTGLAAEASGDRQVTLTWNSVEGADSYNIYRDGAANADGITGTKYTNTGLTKGTSYSYTVSATNNIGESAVSTAVPIEATDDHGDSRETATPVNAGSNTAGTIDLGNPSSDLDYFRVVIVEEDITLIAESTDATVNVIGSIIDSDGNVLSRATRGVDNLNFKTRYKVPNPGTYYIRVNTEQAVFVTPDSYMLSVSIFDDSHGHIPATATAVTDGSTTMGQINPTDDVDYFSIMAEAGQIIRAYTTSSLDTVGEIRSSEDAVLMTGEDDTGADYNFDLGYRVVANGTHYITVSTQDNNNTARTGNYMLTVSLLTDEHGESVGDATAVTSGTPITGRIHNSDDDDYFSIVVSAGQIIRAYTTGTTDTTGSIHDSDDDQLARNDNSGEDTNFEIVYKPSSAGTYYIKVDGSTGDYTLTVSLLTDMHGGSTATATAVTAGSMTAGGVFPETDIDYFSIALTAGQTLRASTTGTTDTFGTIRTDDDFSTVVDSDDNGGDGLNFSTSYTVPATTSGAVTYYISVASNNNNSTGEYTLVVSVE